MCIRDVCACMNPFQQLYPVKLVSFSAASQSFSQNWEAGWLLPSFHISYLTFVYFNSEQNSNPNSKLIHNKQEIELEPTMNTSDTFPAPHQFRSW